MSTGIPGEDSQKMFKEIEKEREISSRGFSLLELLRGLREEERSGAEKQSLKYSKLRWVHKMIHLL